MPSPPLQLTNRFTHINLAKHLYNHWDSITVYTGSYPRGVADLYRGPPALSPHYCMLLSSAEPSTHRSYSLLSVEMTPPDPL